ncbi:Uncharacterised protein [Neisseria animaloris]|uniref:Transmembrane protein n=1 Tax=Neisseria animaloris TaxID=326522 RepID=A0A3S4XRQ7_9NEIS|nr:Uncharacterised protein [Neisseria animaloris]
MRAALSGFQRCRFSPCHRRVIASKVFSRAACRSCLACCLAALGSCPVAIRRRAFSAASQASLKETAGYLPIESNFSLPSMRYFSRHNFPPAGVTCKNIPLPSASLYGLAAGLAFFIWRSFSGIWGYFFRGVFQIPLNIPPFFGLFN